MKKNAFRYLSLTAMAVLAPLPGMANVILFQENFETQTVGERPTGFDQLRPSVANTVAYGEEMAVGMMVVEGLNGQALHMWDYWGSQPTPPGNHSTVIEKNFAASAAEQFSRIRFDVTVQPFTDTGTGSDAGDALVIALLSFNPSLSIGAMANRAMDVRFRHNGTFTIRSGAPGSDGESGSFFSTTYDTEAPSTVSIFANSSLSSIFYEGADGNSRLLNPLSFDVYLNNALVGDGNYEFQGEFFHENVNTLGKFGLVTGTAAARLGMDFLVDDLMISTFIPEPSTYALFAGLALLAFAACRRRKAS